MVRERSSLPDGHTWTVGNENSGEQHEPNARAENAAGLTREEHRTWLKGAIFFVVAGIVLLLIGLYLTTWEQNYHLGSVWTYINQVASTGEPWSAGAIYSNRHILAVAGANVVAGLVSLSIGVAIFHRRPRR